MRATTDQSVLVDRLIAYINIDRQRGLHEAQAERQRILDNRNLTQTEKSAQLATCDSLIKNNQPLSAQERTNYRKGLCYGFSVMHSYMNAEQKLDWWKELLITLSQWDGQEASLATQTNLSQSRSTNETYDSLFRRCTDAVLFHQGDTHVTQTRESQQFQFLTPNGLFESGTGEKIKPEAHTTAIGTFSDKNLMAMLDEATFSSQSICLI